MVRGARLLLIACLVLVLGFPSSASAETAAQLRSELRRLQSKASKAGREFSAAYWRLDETEVAIIRTRRNQRAAERRLHIASARLDRRVNGIYRKGAFDVLGFLMGSSSFEQFVTRADYMTRIGGADARLVAEVRRRRRDLATQERRLRTERRQRRADLTALRARRDRLQSRLRSLQADYARVKARLDRVRSGGSLPAGVVSAAGGNGMVFPVAGAHYYANTWGASRSGGRRRHQGTDIMSPRGTPCVAAASGTVRTSNNRLGGLSIWLRSDSGWSFYYAHLSRYAVRGGHVRAGQVIGYVGSTGNAAGGAPHLHFQMHPHGGSPVNPYPYLRAME